MANFLLLVDADPKRRAQFVRRAETQLAPVNGLVTSSLTVGDFAATWAVRERAPVSTMAAGNRASVVWGDAISGPGPGRIDARELDRSWQARGRVEPLPFDGFHAAVHFDTAQGLTVGADVLGLFPVYYACSGGVVMVGSSPELFRMHPLFPPKFSHEGLVGLLLTHALFEGQSLLQGVRRLRPGHLLVWQPGGSVREIEHYAIPASGSYDGLPFPDHVEILDQVFADAMRRHAPAGTPVGILLSGGRDSRLLGGYLEHQGNRVRALTLGWESDYEVSCAVPVARALGFEHSVASLDYEDFPWSAELQTRWEHLATGFSNIHMWGAIEPLRALPPSFVSGYLREVREIHKMPAAFEPLFRSNNRGIPPERLKRLLRPEAFGDLIDDTFLRIRNAYESCSPVPAQRPWRFFLANYWRFHAGGVPWRLSFGAWPVLPILDRDVLEVIAALPDSSLAGRRSQDEILRSRFPKLARLPLDRNDFSNEPLVPSIPHRVARVLTAMARPVRRLNRGANVERRYYHRIYDYNGPGWRAVRRLAEPHREQLADLFDMDELSSLVPRPEVKVEMDHGIRDAFGRKLLTGFMLWSREHLV